MVVLGGSFLALQAATVSLSYRYDGAGRLNTVNYNGDTLTAYGYDKSGNLLSRITAANVLPSLAATYNGLAINALPAVDNIGPIALKLLPTGAFTGSITLAGRRYSFKSIFAPDGSSPAIIITRKAPLNNLTLMLTLDVAASPPQITGTISDGNFVSATTLDITGFNAKTNPLPAGFIGRYTALFMPTDANPIIPQADGYATLNIISSGVIQLAGKLANNVPITRSYALAHNGTWPLFVPLYSNTGYVAGTVAHGGTPGVNDLGATLAWLKPATSGALHPAAFTNSLSFIGSRYDRPPTGQPALQLFNEIPNATFEATGGNLTSSPLMVDVTLDTRNKFLPIANSSKLKLSLAVTTGVVTGSFVDNSKLRKIGAVVFQEQNIISGFFPGETESGLVQIEEAP